MHRVASATLRPTPCASGAFRRPRSRCGPSSGNVARSSSSPPRRWWAPAPEGIPADRVAAIRGGSRRNDRVGDLHKIALLFREFAEVARNRTAVTEAALVDAEAFGERLRALSSRGARRVTASAALVDARRTRDALGWMLSTRYDALVAVAGWLWGRRLAQHVPALTTRPGARRAKPAPAVATPVAAPVPSPIAATG